MKKKIIALAMLVVVVAVIVVATQHLLTQKNSTNSTNNTNKTADNNSTNQSAGKTGSTSPSSTPPSATQTRPDNTAASTSVQTITISSAAFSPPALTIRKGLAVTWVNNDAANHAIDRADSDNDGLGPHSPQLKTGESYKYTFTKVGTYHYKCVIQPSLTGIITVTE